MQAKIIIFATAYFPLVGGAEVAMKEVTDRLSGWQFDLFCARIKPGLPDMEKIGNVTVHRVGFGHPVDKYLLPILGPLVARQTVDNTQHATVWSLMASYGGFAALVYTWMRPQTKMLLTLQEGDPLEHYAKRVGWFAFLHRRIFERADAGQAISTFLASWAKTMGFKGHPKVIPNGVDIKQFTDNRQHTTDNRTELRSRLGFVAQDIVIITVSRLSLKNGIDDLIRSLAHLASNFKALIVGEGEDRERLATLALELGLTSRIVFLGFKSHDELPEILQAADIFCRPSLSEGLGNAFLEAMVAGLPIIGTPVGGVPDFLQDGETGVWCRSRDPVSIAQAVMRIQNEPELRAKLIRQGAALVRQRYGWDKIAKQIDELLHSLVT